MWNISLFFSAFAQMFHVEHSCDRILALLAICSLRNKLSSARRISLWTAAHRVSIRSRGGLRIIKVFRLEHLCKARPEFILLHF